MAKNTENILYIDRDNQKRVKEVVSYKISMLDGDSLSKYIIGLKTDDPKIIEKLKEDQKNIREKYELPDRKLISESPENYEYELKNIAKKEGFKIKKRSNNNNIFKNHDYIGGCCFENIIYFNMDRSSRRSYIGSLGLLTHELIHAKQDRINPYIPIEIQEYEAYVGSANINYYKNNPKRIKDLFGFYIGGSVEFYNNQLIEISGSVWEKVDVVQRIDLDKL